MILMKFHVARGLTQSLHGEYGYRFSSSKCTCLFFRTRIKRRLAGKNKRIFRIFPPRFAPPPLGHPPPIPIREALMLTGFVSLLFLPLGQGVFVRPWRLCICVRTYIYICICMYCTYAFRSNTPLGPLGPRVCIRSTRISL